MDKYFAQSETTELLPLLIERIKDFNLNAERTGKRRRWEAGYKAHYGQHLGETGGRSTAVQNVGENGELAAVAVNHYRNLNKHVLSITTTQKPSFDPRAKNTDLKSLQQSRMANNIIDSYISEKRMGRHLMSVAERSLVMNTAFLYMTWEPSLGRPYSVQQVEGANGEATEKVVYEGDVSARAKSPHDVVFDISTREWSQNRWVIVREWENKWDLAARHPEKAAEIIEASASGDIDLRYLHLNGGLHMNEQDQAKQDLIPVYHFYHLKCDAVMNGRYVKFLNAKTHLFDGPIPYRKRLPIFRMTPGEVFDTAEGYSDSLDVLVLQQVVNTLYSTAFTNEQAFGVQVIWIPDGCEVSPTQLGKGLAVLKGGPPGSEPKPLNLTATPPEIFNNIKMVESAMEKLMGINSVIRGDPDHGLKSGVALGRLQAMAIQYSSPFQKAWAELLEDCGTFLLELLQDFAKTERMVAMAGKTNKGAMKSFTGDDLDLIERVSVDLGNPIQNTTAGRIEMAESLLAKGAITAKQYIQVATTGNIETATEAAQSQEELIRKENESLMEGEPVKATVGDAHIMHAQEHMTVINDPQLRTLAAQGDPEAAAVLSAVTAHIMEHKELYTTQDPFMTMIAGEPPPPPGPMPPMMPSGPPPPGMAPEAMPPGVPPFELPPVQ